MAEPESSALCVLVDYENMARPGVKGRGDFDIHLVLNRLADKGRVLVKRAYADWSRYRDARHDLQNAGLELIEMPSAREGAKNRADIKMAVDAMEFAFSRDHLTDFVIVSGDSDFTPLVGKLRELNKRVTGMGNRDSASELLIANCDEFIFYDNLAARASAGASAGGRTGDPIEMLRGTLTALQREGVEWPLASVVKDSMRRKNPAFDENEVGFSTFSKFLDTASKKGIVRLETDPRSGTYRVELAEGGTTSAPPSGPTATAERPSADGEQSEGRGRRRRRPRRGEQSSPAAESSPDVDSTSDVFEFVVEPTIAVDMSALPPIDQPISYEDMIMLGPELGEDIPELVEASDAAVDTEEAPATSRRRRRRRGSADEQTTEDVVEPVAEVTNDATPADEEPAPTSRRRRRRTTAAPVEETVVDETPAETIDVVAEVAPVVEAPEAPADEEAPTRRRVRRGSRVAELLGEEAEPAAEAADEEAAPKRRRRTTKAADTEATEAPKPRARRTTKKTDATDASASEEAPAPKRRTRRTTAADTQTAETPVVAESDETPAPKRRVRRKAAEPAAE